MLGLRSQYALSTFLVANMQQDLHFTYVQDDIRVNDKLTLNAGLRYEYATPMWEKNNVADELRSGQPDDDHREGRIDLRPRAGRSRPQQLRPARRLRLHADAEDRGPRRLGPELRPHQPHRIGQPARHQRPAGRARRGEPEHSPRRNFLPTEQGYPVGLAIRRSSTR
jgi:hypothetical protein